MSSGPEILPVDNQDRNVLAQVVPLRMTLRMSIRRSRQPAGRLTTELRELVERLPFIDRTLDLPVQIELLARQGGIGDQLRRRGSANLTELRAKALRLCASIGRTLHHRRLELLIELHGLREPAKAREREHQHRRERWPFQPAPLPWQLLVTCMSVLLPGECFLRGLLSPMRSLAGPVWIASPDRVTSHVCSANRQLHLTRLVGTNPDAVISNLVKLARVSTTPRIALVAGASGTDRGFLIQALLEAPDYSRVFALTRRPFGREHPKLANRIVVFERMAEQLKGLAANEAFCCLGTTIAAAGSQEAFREADVDAVLLFAQAARAAGATRFVVVSSVRASAKSSKFYLRTKAEMEDAVAAVGFPSLDILQPSLLLGPRKESRPLESLGSFSRP